jgi:hypothetical protein
MNIDRRFRLIKEQFIASILQQPIRRREVLMLFRQNNYQEIAAKLNITENTVSKHISNFCKEFQLKKYFPEESKKTLPELLKKILNQYIDNIIADEIRRSIGFREDEIEIQNLLNKPRGKIVIVLDIDRNKFDTLSLLEYLKRLRKQTGDNSMNIDAIEDGSVKLTISGTVEGCQKLKSLFDAGELTEISDIPVLDVYSVEVETEDSIWTKLNNWLQSNILPDWELEETVSATIAAFKSHPDFSAAPAFGVQMSANNEVELNTAIAELLTSLNSQALDIVRLAAQRLAELEVNTPEVINALKQKLNATEDVETQWQIALALSKIAPEEHPNAKAQKQILELGNITLEIVLGIKNNEDDFVDILLEIRPDWDDYLPPGLEVKILEESGEDFWQDEFVSTQLVTEEQAYIYFSFWGTSGDKFILQLTLEDTVLQKHFQI